MDAFIKAVTYYLPEKILTNEDLEKQFPEWSADKIYLKVGIRNRHIAEENETALDLAEKACHKLFSETECKNDIDFILLCTQSADYKLPTSACILQNRLELDCKTGALDFNLGCSGYEYGLSLAKGLICGNMAKNVLLVTAETYSKYIHKEDKGNRSIFGDAATATLVSTEGFAKIQNFEFGTDGSKAEQLILKTGGTKFPEKKNQIAYDQNNHIISPDNLYMDGEGIFSFTIKRVPPMIRNLLSSHNLELSDIDLFIFHQANAYMLQYLQKKLKIEDDKFFVCLEDVGNTVSNTIPIAICRALKTGKLEGKKRVLLAGYGVGLSWCGCIIEI